MAQTSTMPVEKPEAQRAPVVNECSIQIATVNGTGSQSANNTLLRAIFQMGVPVSGKNLFPSNIAGLPTWFTIRANKEGYIARRKDIDVLVCLNATGGEDHGIPAGGACSTRMRCARRCAATSSSTPSRSRISAALCPSPSCASWS